MRVNEIYYETNFPLAEKFCFEKIGVKLSIEKGDDAKEVLKQARDWTVLRHRELNPHLYPKPKTEIDVEMPTTELPVIQEKER